MVSKTSDSSTERWILKLVQFLALEVVQCQWVSGCFSVFLMQGNWNILGRGDWFSSIFGICIKLGLILNPVLAKVVHCPGMPLIITACKNAADKDACYVSKVWWFVFIWAGLALFFFVIFFFNNFFWIVLFWISFFSFLFIYSDCHLMNIK